jgi:hypothetical protein
MNKSIAVLVGLAVVFACSSAWAGWGYIGPGRAVVYRPYAPVVTYYSPVAPVPVVTASPVLTPEAVVYPGAVMVPAPAVFPARVYYRPARPFVRVWLP